MGQLAPFVPISHREGQTCWHTCSSLPLPSRSLPFPPAWTMMWPSARRQTGSGCPPGASSTPSFTPWHSPALASHGPTPAAPSALRPPTARRRALYIPTGQSRSHGPPRLPPNVRPPAPMARKSATTLTVARAPGKAALGPMCALSTAQSAAPHPGRHSRQPRGQPTTTSTSTNTPSSPPPLPHPLLPPSPAVVTPIHAPTLASLLARHPDRHFATYLTRGFHFGFSTGHTGPRTSTRSPNLPSALARHSHPRLPDQRVRYQPHRRTLPLPSPTQLRGQPPLRCPQQALREVAVDNAPLLPPRQQCQ